jgi:hypothetical protein
LPPPARRGSVVVCGPCSSSREQYCGLSRLRRTDRRARNRTRAPWRRTSRSTRGWSRPPTTPGTPTWMASCAPPPRRKSSGSTSSATRRAAPPRALRGPEPGPAGEPRPPRGGLDRQPRVEPARAGAAAGEFERISHAPAPEMMAGSTSTRCATRTFPCPTPSAPAARPDFFARMADRQRRRAPPLQARRLRSAPPLRPAPPGRAAAPRRGARGPLGKAS